MDFEIVPAVFGKCGCFDGGGLGVWEGVGGWDTFRGASRVGFRTDLPLSGLRRQQFRRRQQVSWRCTSTATLRRVVETRESLDCHHAAPPAAILFCTVIRCSKICNEVGLIGAAGCTMWFE